MNYQIIAKASYLLSIVTPVTILWIMMTKIGAGGGAIIPIALMMFMPFTIGGLMAFLTKRRPFSASIVLLGIIGITTHGFIGVYNAFYRIPAMGAIDIIYRPIDQTFMMLGIAVALSLLTVARKLKRGHLQWNKKQAGN